MTPENQDSFGLYEARMRFTTNAQKTERNHEHHRKFPAKHDELHERISDGVEKHLHQYKNSTGYNNNPLENSR